MCLTMMIQVRTELFQRQQTELAAKVSHPQLTVVAVVLPLEFHGPQTHADPRVKLLEQPTTRCKAGGEANLSLVLAVVLRLQSVSSFTPRPPGRGATPILLPSLRRGRFRQPSPLRRVVGTPSPVAYRFDLPTVGRRRTSPVMAWNHFLQAATCSTHGSPPPITAYPAEGRASDSPVLHPRAVTGTPHRPKRRLPKSSCLAPSTRPLLRSPRWSRASGIPPMNYEVRAGSSVRARTRTGRLWRMFSLLSLPHRLFRGRLNSPSSLWSRGWGRPARSIRVL